jgi:C_GCAxxG_C_C family probable redox protein
MERNSKVTDAVNCFNSGFNCSQAILSAYCEEFNLDKNTALKIACGFGGGMGRLQETCGAVTGAYMLIGLKHGKFKKEDAESKDKTYTLVREFAKQFVEKNKTTSCCELLGIDLNNSDKDLAKEKIKTICPKLIQDAAEIIEGILFNNEA